MASSGQYVAVPKANFESIRQNHQFYVDKTWFACDILRYPRALLLRPPRMGKSLFLSTLQCLYDLRYKEQFYELFSGLYAGNNPPALKHSLYVLRITLPAIVSSEKKDENQIIRAIGEGILDFLKNYEQHLESMNVESDFLKKMVYQGSVMIVLGNIVRETDGNMMVLVDEIDRALMDGTITTEIDAATKKMFNPLIEFVTTLKKFADKYVKFRFYATGIFEVPEFVSSTFNSLDVLTHLPEYATGFGFLYDDVERGLQNRLRITNKHTRANVMEMLSRYANGYNFFGAKNSVYNPQLIHKFFAEYQSAIRNKRKPPTHVYDPNLKLSTNQKKKMTSNPILSRTLLRICVSGETIIKSFNGEISYLYQLGVLTLSSLGQIFDPKSTYSFGLANICARRDYVQPFLESLDSNTLASKTNNLLKNLDPPSIKELLDFVIGCKRLTNEQNEVDLQCIFMAALYMNTEYDVGAGKHAGNDRKLETDVKVIVKDKFVLIFELKVIRAAWESGCTQRLNISVSKSLGLTTANRGEQYPSDGLARLNEMSMAELLALKVTYTNKGTRYHTVGEVHQSARTQVEKYANAEVSASVPQPVIAFAVTIVLNRVIVDKVYDGRPPALTTDPDVPSTSLAAAAPITDPDVTSLAAAAAAAVPTTLRTHPSTDDAVTAASDSKLFVLYESAAGYALFEVLEGDSICQMHAEVQESVTDIAKFGKFIKLVSFQNFVSSEDALSNINNVSEGILDPSLQAFLETNLPVVSKKKKKKKGGNFKLGVVAPNLAQAIKAELDISCITDETVKEISRGIRLHLSSFNKRLGGGLIDRSQLGLAHSYSRAKIKFNVNRSDNMIIQAIAMIDQMDKDLNKFVMRVREWYSWHFPELQEYVKDIFMYAKVAQYIGDRNNLSEEKLEGLTAITMDDELSNKILEASRMSMGMDVSDVDIANVKIFASKIISLSDYRAQLMTYLQDKMSVVAPNLAALIGDVVAARLISHAGSLTSLAKCPASTVQILGAEKALFRALKTKGNTPKYGLIFHSSFISRASSKCKGRISRYLANKCALSARIDAFSEFVTAEYGKAMNKQVEERLSFYESGTVPRKNIDVMHETALKVHKAKTDAEAKASASKPAKRKKSQDKEEEPKKKKKKKTEKGEKTKKKKKTDNTTKNKKKKKKIES